MRRRRRKWQRVRGAGPPIVVLKLTKKHTSVKVGLRQGFVISPWLFNLLMNGLTKEFKAKILKEGVKFGMGENRGRVSGLFADDTTLMAESESNLQRYASAFCVIVIKFSNPNF